MVVLLVWRPIGKSVCLSFKKGKSISSERKGNSTGFNMFPFFKPEEKNLFQFNSKPIEQLIKFFVPNKTWILGSIKL
jgi:hypothetical protein